MNGLEAGTSKYSIDRVECEIVVSALHGEGMPRGLEIRVAAQSQSSVLQRDEQVNDAGIVTVDVQVGGEKLANGGVLRRIEARVILLQCSGMQIVSHGIVLWAKAGRIGETEWRG